MQGHSGISEGKTKPIDKSWVNVMLKSIFKQYGILVGGNTSLHLFRKIPGNRVLRLNNYLDESVILLMTLLSWITQHLQEICRHPGT